MTRNEAFAIARTRVGALYSTGRGQYSYNVWSEHHRAWWQSRSQPLAQARESRCRALVQATLVALGWRAFDAACAADDYHARGDYRTRVRAILARNKTA